MVLTRLSLRDAGELYACQITELRLLGNSKQSFLIDYNMNIKKTFQERELKMAKNDIEVIEYKILAYLYESLKAGHTATLEEVAWKCRLFDITREYWLVIMKDLIDNGYVSGLKYVEAKDMECVLETGTFAITGAGT